jgi:hypothetical protein
MACPRPCCSSYVFDKPGRGQAIAPPIHGMRSRSRSGKFILVVIAEQASLMIHRLVTTTWEYLLHLL